MGRLVRFPVGVAGSVCMNATNFDAFETWLRASGAAESTVEARVRYARYCEREWGYSLALADPDAIRANLARPGLSKWSRTTYFNHLRSAFRWLVETGELDHDPMDRMRRPRPPRDVPRPLTDLEAARVDAAATGVVREWIMLAMLAGLRAHEVAQVKGEDVTETFIFVDGKGGQQAFIPTHPDLWALAQRKPRMGYWYPSYTHDGHIRGETVSSRVTALFRSLNIEGSLHRCRHSFGTNLVRGGTSLTVVQSLMRHASLNTTAAYIKVGEDERRAAVGSLGMAC